MIPGRYRLLVHVHHVNRKRVYFFCGIAPLFHRSGDRRRVLPAIDDVTIVILSSILIDLKLSFPSFIVFRNHVDYLTLGDLY